MKANTGRAQFEEPLEQASAQDESFQERQRIIETFNKMEPEYISTLELLRTQKLLELQKPVKGLNDYDQSKKFDGDKIRFELIPKGVEKALAEVLTYGANKYSANSWQTVEPFEERYYGALRRHLDWWLDGQSVDPESGLLHLAHAFCCLAFLLSREVEKQNDR